MQGMLFFYVFFSILHLANGTMQDMLFFFSILHTTQSSGLIVPPFVGWRMLDYSRQRTLARNAESVVPSVVLFW